MKTKLLLPLLASLFLVLADAVSITAVIIGARNELGPVGVPGLAGMVLAAPAVHVSQEQGGRALGSLGLRLGMPIAGAALAVWMHERDQKGRQECDCMGGILAGFGGMALGLTSAMVVDALFLGWRRQPVAERSVALLPSLAVTPNGAAMGLAGRF